jgi:hypothetical protein
MKKVREHLAQMLTSGKIPHAILLGGARNREKKTEAYWFARNLLDTKKSIDNHPDIHLLFPEGKTEMHPISALRQLIHDASLAPFESSWKVFILHEAEKMLPTSSNALLKVLEEPPSHTLIFLLSDHPERLLPTIISRCQTIDFPPATDVDIDPSMLALLVANPFPADITDFESENTEAVFETLLFWYRDRFLLEIGGSEDLLHFPEHISAIQKAPLLPLVEVESVIKKCKLAFERSTKLSICLEMFFLSFRSY